MRILIFSDLHANRTALDAALDAAKGRWDRVLCLGDIVGYGPDPNEVTAKIRELQALTIRGNHDKAVCGLMPTHDFNPVARAAAEWTRAELRPENLEFLRALPPGPIETDGLGAGGLAASPACGRKLRRAADRAFAEVSVESRFDRTAARRRSPRGIRGC